MKNNEKIAIKVSVISIILNCLLTLIKFISGVISKSSAMISDSVHSLSDVLSTFVVIIGVKISNKKADSDACEIGVFSQKDLANIELAFDHEKIIKDCLKAVSSKFQC